MMSSSELAVDNIARPRQLLIMTSIMVAFLAAASAPSPLYTLYQASWHFSTPMLTFVFALYMFTLLLTLLIAGHLSDYLGRRPVIQISLIVEIVAMLCFLAANGLTGLLIARALQGIATGLATSALSAALVDNDHHRGPVLGSIAPMIGMGVGAPFSALLMDYAPFPLRLGFLFMTVIFLCQLVGLRGTQESVAPRAGALASLRPHVQIIPSVWPVLLRVIPANIAAWSLGGFFLSLGPLLTHDITGLHDSMIGGATLSFLCVTSAVGILYMRQRSTWQILLFSGVLMPLGVAIMLLSLSQHSTWMLFFGIMLAGPGLGTGFMGAMRAILHQAPASERSALSSVLYMISYLSASVPALVAGISIQYAGLEPTVYGYGIYVIVLSVTALVGVLCRREELS